MQNKINLIYNQYNLVHYNQSTDIFLYIKNIKWGTVDSHKYNVPYHTNFIIIKEIEKKLI